MTAVASALPAETFSSDGTALRLYMKQEEEAITDLSRRGDYENAMTGTARISRRGFMTVVTIARRRPRQ